MHQPDYRDTLTHEYVLPWTYLHAIKDYTDMAYHLEQNEKARVTVNWVPVLLDQLEDYAEQYKTGMVRDPLLALLMIEDFATLSNSQCDLILESCFKSHHEKMLQPFAHYQRLFNIYKTLESETQKPFAYLSSQYKADLLVWYHLAWTGESIRKNNKLVQDLMAKGSMFNFDERIALFNLIGDSITDLIPRYKKLEQRGQIEISSTPHYHPILPLLLDFKSARDAMPFAPLPKNSQYPSGRVRAQAHITQAQQSHKKRFGKAPNGMWPAEGGVSFQGLSLMASSGVKWAATGQAVLANSLYKSYPDESLPAPIDYLYKPYRIVDGQHEILCFFRDDGLSDKIGFEYSKIHSNTAVADFVHSLEQIYAQKKDGESAVVSVILDGENAWEYYPYNGYYFLSELYAALASHPNIEMTTFSDIIKLSKEKPNIPVETLPNVVAGSWVYGTFSTWIGSEDKNLGWDLLCDAKKQYDKVMLSGLLSEDEVAACERQLSICEGSDWFWWFGDYNSSVSVSSFDQLYRRNLTNLYRLLRLPVPPALKKAISVGGGDPAVGGTMRRGQE